MSNAADGHLGDWLPHKESCRCTECQLEKAQKRLRDLESRIETLIGTECSRCERGDDLFVEPETGFYTHTLGGNYCSAHRLHSILDTKASRVARGKRDAQSRDNTTGDGVVAEEIWDC